jgi:enamine deaminase RidA (YjgF/YER057c/UK114 family)
VPGASLSDIVSVRQWLTSAEDVRAYVEVRSKFITHKPAALLGVIPGLVRPDFLIEMEVVAAVPAGKVKGGPVTSHTRKRRPRDSSPAPGK